MPEGFGYYWDYQPPPQAPYYKPVWAMNTHLMWMHKGYSPDIYIRLNLGFTPDPVGDSLIDIVPVWFDIDNCGDSEWDVPGPKQPGKNYKATWEYTMPQGGQFIAMGGHLHDGGRQLGLFNVTRNEEVFTSKATYKGKTLSDAGFDLRKMSTFSGFPGVDVSEGDVLRLTAVYDHSKNWKDVMGIMIGALYVQE